MRKQVFGRQLQRDSNERKALFKSLVSALVINEQIKTTEAKAKAVRGQIEKMITKVRNNSQEARRMFQGYFTQPVLEKFIGQVAPRFAKRTGGYTRIIKVGNRFGDNARVVILEWVEKPSVESRITNQELSKTEGSKTKTQAVVARSKAMKQSPSEKKESKQSTKTKKSTKKK